MNTNQCPMYSEKRKKGEKVTVKKHEETEFAAQFLEDNFWPKKETEEEETYGGSAWQRTVGNPSGLFDLVDSHGPAMALGAQRDTSEKIVKEKT